MSTTTPHRPVTDPAGRSTTNPVGSSDRLGWRLLLVVAVAGVLGAAIGIPAHATYGARTTADEPYYLLTAISLAADGDLDIGDELAGGDSRPFHEIPVDPQTTPLDGGRQVSPHDLLLPLILSPAVAVAGWVGAKSVLAVLAGLTAAATAAVAVREFAVRPRIAALVAGGVALAMPLAPYGSQVYPELPAALMVLGGVWATTQINPAATARAQLAAPLASIAVAVALPWLSVKYVPVAAAMVMVAGWRLWTAGRRRVVLAGTAALIAAGATYLVAHQLLYGGWTVYAAGDHFVQTGELSVVGVAPDHVGRARRLVGLLVDRDFGIATWAPVWLAAPAGVAAVLASRHPHRWALLAPLAAGWLTASFVALTMHGWWVPGRQVVVVLPLLTIAVAVLVDRTPRLLVPTGIALVAGASSWIWLALESATGRRTLVVDFTETAAIAYRAMAAVTPDGQIGGIGADLLLAAWALLLAASAAWARRRERSC